MSKKNPSGPAEIPFVPALLMAVLFGLVVFSLFTGYFLVLAWLLTVLAPLTYFQAAVFAFVVVASGFWNLARLPQFELSVILLFLLVFAVLALLEILVAHLVAFITPLVVWEASLLVAACVALLMFIVIQTVLDSPNYDELGDYDDDEWNASTVARRLSPDMYVMKPRVTETPTPRPPRAPRKRKKKADEPNTD
ncbi:MAG: hypothetical protein KJZ86_11585 [Caldilineaceae bacterium]|nr:hypothetical protein [Caldilineaceae bacterium]